MKKALFVIIISLLLVSFAACGNKTADSMSEPEAAKTTAVSAESAQDSDEPEAAPEETELPWPDDRLPSSVPKLKGIKVIKTEEIENGIEITFTGCDEDETKNYTVQLTRKGWDFETENTDAGKTVYAGKDNESLIFFSPIYDDSNDIGTITYTSTD